MPEMVPGQALRAPQPAPTSPRLSLEDPNVRVEFATAISRPGGRALLIDAHNRAVKTNGVVVEWSPIAAAYRDKVHAVEVAPHLMVLDIDILNEDVAAAAANRDHVVDAAAAAGVPHVVVESGSGWHIYLVVGDVVSARVQRLRAALAAYGDCVRFGRGQRIRPIGARHRRARQAGGVVRAKPVGSVADALATIQGPPATAGQIDDLADAIHRDAPASVQPRARLRLRRPDLSDTARRIARAPMPAAGDLGGLADYTTEGTRSALVHVVACSAAAAGWTADEFLTFARSTWLGEYARTKQPNNPRAWLQADYGRALAFIDSAPPPQRDATSEHQQLRVALAAAPGVAARWWREGGHALLDAILALTASRGTRTVHLSVRAAAELTNTSKSAAHRHLVHLERAGLIDRSPGEGAAAGAVVGVRTAAVRALVPQTPDRGAWQECPTSEQQAAEEATLDLLDTRSADLWTWHGLGHTTWRAYVSAATNGGTVDADALGVSPRWAAHLQRRIDRHRLLDGDREQRLIDAAAALDVAGRLRMLHVVHADDRETFAPVAARIDAKVASLSHPDAAEQLALTAA